MSTVDNLHRKRFCLANRCVMCYSDAETVDHLFLRCSFASEVWSRLSSKISLHGTFSSLIEEFIQRWKDLNCLSSFSSAMKVLPHALLWFLWKERNDRIFNDAYSSPCLVLRRLCILVGDWLTFAGSFSATDLSAWRRLVFDNG
ncbi:hypothetical protein LINPERHAP1_LOCUS8598 [Linum perenne]